MSEKNIYRRRRVSKSWNKTEAQTAEEMLDWVVGYAAENSLVSDVPWRWWWQLAELFVPGDREFQTADAMMLNALDWKLSLVLVDSVPVG